MEYIKHFMRLFKRPPFNEATNYINHLEKEMKYYLEHLSNYLNKNFLQNIENISDSSKMNIEII